MSRYLINRNSPLGVLDPFFEDFFTKENSSNDLMKTDIKDEGDHYLMKIDVPEILKEDIKLSLEDGYLNVSVSLNKEREENDKKGKYIYRERHFGNYSRNYYVGENVKQEDIKARLENGVLNLTINKVEEPQVKENKYITIE